jgi:hypothetical protein
MNSDTLIVVILILVIISLLLQLFAVGRRHL